MVDTGSETVRAEAVDGWVVDAAIVLDEGSRTTLVAGDDRSIPDSWQIVLEGPIRIDALGNFDEADAGVLPTRSKIERLVVGPGHAANPPAAEGTGIAQVEALVRATRSPLRVPRLLSSIARLLRTLGEHKYCTHPAVSGVPVTDPPLRQGSGAGLWRAPFLDAIMTDGETLVLRAVEDLPKVERLERTDALIWATADGSDADHLIARTRAACDEAGMEPMDLDRVVDDLRSRSFLESAPSWRSHPSTAWVDGTGYAAVLPVGSRSETPVILAGPAYSVWKELCLHQAISLHDLIEVIAAEYMLDPRDIEGDVRGLVEQLHESAVVVHV